MFTITATQEVHISVIFYLQIYTLGHREFNELAEGHAIHFSAVVPTRLLYSMW